MSARARCHQGIGATIVEQYGGGRTVFVLVSDENFGWRWAGAFRYLRPDLPSDYARERWLQLVQVMVKLVAVNVDGIEINTCLNEWRLLVSALLALMVVNNLLLFGKLANLDIGHDAIGVTRCGRFCQNSASTVYCPSPSLQWRSKLLVAPEQVYAICSGFCLL